jgi:hypothetical protein
MDKPVTSSIEIGHIMDTGSIDKRQRMDKPETHAVLKQDVEWTN